MSCQAVLATVLHFWEAVQVELHGRYSLHRFLAFHTYKGEISTFRAVATAALTPLPPLIIVILMDLLPQVSPVEGYTKQTFGFWAKSFFTGWIMAFTTITQICHCTPTLPMSTARLWAISVITALALLPTAYGLILAVGFPVPFATQQLTGPYLFMLVSLTWMSWKDTIRSDPETKANLIKHLQVPNSQVMLIISYTAYNVAFNKLQGLSQTVFAGVLPIMKIAFKNWVRGGVSHLTDIGPTVIVFNVDVFHAIFVSLAMQQSTGQGTNAVIMAVDTIQNVIVYSEIHKVLAALASISERMKQLDAACSDAASASLVSRAVKLIGSSTHPELKRFTADAALTHKQAKQGSLVWDTRHQVLADGPTPAAIEPPSREETPETAQSEPPSQLELAQREFVDGVLKLMNMVEFYVLIEFVEFMMAFIYASYMFALTRLPNRIYYRQLAALTDTELVTRAQNVAGYAALELLSFVVMCLVFSKLTHFSAIRQLAFVLDKHKFLVQSNLIMWVYFVVQISWVHLGADFTFQFEWLKKQADTRAPTV